MIERFDAFVTGITTCYKYIQKIKSIEMTDLGLKGNHVMCIFYLNRNDKGLTAAELSQLCGEDKAAISRTLGRLQEEGYVKSGEKKYRSPLHLTEAGKKIARYVDNHIREWVGRGGDGLSEEERNIFYRSLDIISSNLRETVKGI